MINRDINNQYFFLNFFEEDSLSRLTNHAENLHEIYFYIGKDDYLVKEARFSDIIGDIVRNFIQEHEIDVFYVTSPFEWNFPIYQKEWFTDTKVVATVYDIIPYVMREQYLASASVYQAYLDRVEMLRWMDRCLVISQSVKDDMVNHLQFHPDKIDVIFGAADECFGRIEIPDALREALFAKYEINSAYVMCTGGDDERKNLGGLILAYSMLPAQLIAQYQLVIVCRLNEPSKKRYQNIIQRNHLAGRVILTDFVPNEDLIALYNLAHLLAFPSKHEGFGLPVVEAWACGTPVLTSNNSSLGEIAGDAAVLIDPFSADDLSRGLNKALTDTDLSVLRKKGEERLKLFQWDIVADLTIASLEKAISLKGAPDAAAAEKNGKEKLAVFTPLPPIKSGISDYSVDILNAICGYFDIDVFIDDGYQPDHTLDRSIHIYNHREFKAKAYKYVLYQVGNSEYHVYMYPYIMSCGGTLVLHDYNMHAIAYHVAVQKKNSAEQYRKYLLEDYPANYANEYIRNLKQGRIHPKIFEIELNGFVANYADKIIVHSDEAKTKLLQRDIGRNVKKIHSYAKIEPLVDSNAAKAALNITENTVVFSSFGHIHETKRSMPILKAFHRLCMHYSDVHYYFVGLPDTTIADELYEYIRKNQLENCVTVTGYIDLEKFTRYIDATDICLNLRYPSNGETSGSLMRILSKGKCVMINDIGSFGEIPDACCVKLPSVEAMTESREIELIYQEFERLLNDKARISRICANARKYAETYLDLEKIAKQYVSFIKDNHTSSLTEQMLRDVEKEIHTKNYTNIQIEQLGRTLSYSKNSEPRVKETIADDKSK